CYLAPADYRIASVGVAHPRLVRAVVVGAEEDQGRLFAPNAARLVALRIGTAPESYERVALPRVADRRRERVPRMDAGLVRERHQRAHDRVDLVRVAVG